jgi:hypothetical protein
MSGKKNQTIICKPLSYQKIILQKNLQFTKASTNGIYKNEVQCWNVDEFKESYNQKNKINSNVEKKQKQNKTTNK